MEKTMKSRLALTVEDIATIEQMRIHGNAFEEMQEKVGCTADAVSLVIILSTLVQLRYHGAAAALASSEGVLYIYSALREAQAERSPLVNIAEVKSLNDEVAMLEAVNTVRSLDTTKLKKLLKIIEALAPNEDGAPI